MPAVPGRAAIMTITVGRGLAPVDMPRARSLPFGFPETRPRSREREQTGRLRPDAASGREIEGKEVTPPMALLTALISFIPRDEEGQGLAEYALILALIAIVAIIALIFLGTQVSTILSNVGHSV